MLRIALLTGCLALFVLTAKADQAKELNIQSRLAEIEARLLLTPEQESQLRPILKEHLKSQITTLKNYDLESDEVDDAGAADIQQIRALGEEMSEGSTAIEIQLAEVLSASQMQEFKRIREEQEQEFRGRVLSMAIDGITAALQLTPMQADQVRPILNAHFESQMSILSMHGITPGKNDKRLSFKNRRRLRKDLGKNSAATANQLSAILSEEQLKAFETLQAEQRKKLRKQMK